MGEDSQQLQAGQSRTSEIDSGGHRYRRIMFKTHFMAPGEDIGKAIQGYMSRDLRPGDWVVVSEKCVVYTRGLAIDESEIEPGWWARYLHKFVTPTPYGALGIGTPEKMQKAIELVGLWRILLATCAAAVTRPFGFKGWFYRVAGDQVRSIDGQFGGPQGQYRTKIIPPLPAPDLVAREIADACGWPVVIADINDLGGSIKAVSLKKGDVPDFADILRDNPMGQTNAQTPLAIVRRVT